MRQNSSQARRDGAWLRTVTVVMKVSFATLPEPPVMVSQSARSKHLPRRFMAVVSSTGSGRRWNAPGAEAAAPCGSSDGKDERVATDPDP